MIKLGKIKYKNKLIQIILTEDMKRSFLEINNGKYYNLDIEDLKILKEKFNYTNDILCNKKDAKKNVVRQLLILSSICAINSTILSFRNNLINNNDKILEIYNDDESIETILDNNENLDAISKNHIKSFVEVLGQDFDLSLFKANLKKLKIVYLEENDFKQLLKNESEENNVVAFFKIKEHTIYVDKNGDEFKNLYHELFHTVNNYYDEQNLIFLCYHSLLGKGKALLEGMNAYYTNLYFEDNAYSDERKYVSLLEKIVGPDRVKYYFEKGTVEDTIEDLKNLYGDEAKANKLIMMMDDNLSNKSLMDDECYDENVDEIMDLFQNYLLGAEEKRFDEILKISSNYNSDDQKTIIKLGLNVFISNCNYYKFYYDTNNREIFNERQVSKLSNIYNKLSDYNAIFTKDEFLSYIGTIEDNYEIYSYDDLKNWINGNENQEIDDDFKKIYKK